MADQGFVACGKCEVALQGPEGDAPDDIFTCPECGRSDTRANVIEEAKAFVTDNAARALQAQAKAVADKTTFITYTETESFPEREYRFIWKAA